MIKRLQVDGEMVVINYDNLNAYIARGSFSFCFPCGNAHAGTPHYNMVRHRTSRNQGQAFQRHLIS